MKFKLLLALSAIIIGANLEANIKWVNKTIYPIRVTVEWHTGWIGHNSSNCAGNIQTGFFGGYDAEGKKTWSYGPGRQFYNCTTLPRIEPGQEYSMSDDIGYIKTRYIIQAKTTRETQDTTWPVVYDSAIKDPGMRVGGNRIIDVTTVAAPGGEEQFFLSDRLD